MNKSDAWKLKQLELRLDSLSDKLKKLDKVFSNDLKLFRGSIELNCMTYAIRAHEKYNNNYDGLPYYVHLHNVWKEGYRYKILLHEKELNETLALSAIWVHDILEDCPISYNELKSHVGEEIADIAYALTNNKGKTREERANDDYYSKIKENPYALYVKLCDRIANVRYSITTNSSMMVTYNKEHIQFVSKLNNGEYNDMFLELDSLNEDIKNIVFNNNSVVGFP